MARAARYINGDDLVADGTAQELFSTAEPGRIGVRVVLVDEDPDARVYIGTANTVADDAGVLAVLGPGQAANIECSDQQELWMISDGSNRDVCVWEVMDA